MIEFKFKHLWELNIKKHRLLIWWKNILITKIFINSNTSSDCLHFKDVVLHDRLNLPERTLRCQFLRWYGRVLPNLVSIFPKLDSLQCPQLSVTPDHQKLKVLTLHWNHTLALVSVGSRPTRPSHFPSFLQSSLNSFLVAHHCHLDWMN